MKKALVTVLGVGLLSGGLGAGAGTFLSAGTATASEEQAQAESTGDEYAEGPKKGEGEEEKAEPVVVEVGRLMVPIYKPNSISYVVANLAVSVTDEKKAEHFKTESGATEVRNHVLTAMHELAETTVMEGANLDTDKISNLVHKAIKPTFKEIDEVLFVSLVKTDMGR